MGRTCVFRMDARRSLPAIAEFCEEAEDFEVDPDEGDHQCETAVPFGPFGSTDVGHAFNHIEVENEIHGRDDDHDEAEGDAGRRALMNKGNRGAEKTHDHAGEVEQADSECGGKDHFLKGWSCSQEAQLIENQHGEENAEGDTDRLENDARVGSLEVGGECA